MALQGTKGFWTVIAALAGNLIVTAMKFFAAFVSGSSSMLSEAIHSSADTFNQILILIGLGRSNKKADDSFEYGYGNERSFWALISACGVFFLGAGVTVYKGIEAMSAGHQINFSPVVFVVLAISLVVEFYTFRVAARSLQKDFPEASWTERVFLSDPSTLSVFLEDAVAVIGVFVAFISISLSYYTGSPLWDAGGSLVIAVLLAFVAVTLIIKNRSYLIGVAMPEELQEEVMSLLRAEPAIEQIIDFKSSTIGFNSYRIKCEIEFNGSALLGDAYQQETLRAQYDEIHGDFDEFKRFCVEYADRIPRLIGRKIDDIEARIRKEFPGIRHIDIEIN